MKCDNNYYSIDGPNGRKCEKFQIDHCIQSILGNICTLCDKGYYVDPINSTCNQCRKHCLECNSDKCTLWEDGYPEQNEKDKLSPGAIAGIVIACIVVAAIVVVLGFFLVIKKKNEASINEEADVDNL